MARALGNAQRFFQKPPHLPMPQGPIDRRRDESAVRAEQVEMGHHPFGRRKSVGRHVRALALPHQTRNVHIGRAFQPARVAMNAQIGDRLELIAGQKIEAQLLKLGS